VPADDQPQIEDGKQPAVNTNGKDGLIASIVKSLPWNKMNRCDVTNIAFDLIALYFTLQFTEKAGGTMPVLILWFCIVSLALFCVMWASRQ
jgi:hypothetical protein